MIIKGIIQSIDYNNNICTVRMPVFESAGADAPVVAPATFAISPGIFNSYAIGDVVYIGFENNEINLPTVLGKLYTGPIEIQKERGYGNFDSITAKKDASIPVSTRLIKSNNDTDIYSGFDSIGDIIKAIKSPSATFSAKTNKYTSTEKAIGEWIDGKTLYRKTYTINDTIQQNTSWGPKSINLEPLNCDTVMVDLTHTIQIGTRYSLNEYNAPGGDYFNTYINQLEKKLYYRGRTPDQETVKQFIITIEYTKK